MIDYIISYLNYGARFHSVLYVLGILMLAAGTYFFIRKMHRPAVAIIFILGIAILGWAAYLSVADYRFTHRFVGDYKKNSQLVDFGLYVPDNPPSGYKVANTGITMSRDNKPYLFMTYHKPYKNEPGQNLEISVDEHKVPAVFSPPTNCTSGTADVEPGFDEKFPTACQSTFVTPGGNTVYETNDSCIGGAYVKKEATLIFILHTFYDETGAGCNKQQGREKLGSFIDQLKLTPPNKLKFVNAVGS